MFPANNRIYLRRHKTPLSDAWSRHHLSSNHRFHVHYLAISLPFPFSRTQNEDITIIDNTKIWKLTPKKMFLDVSKPAAYILAIFVSNRSHSMRQANLDIVLCITLFSPVLSPGIVSITTKSIGDSDERPICKLFKKNFLYWTNRKFIRLFITWNISVLSSFVYSTMTAWFRDNVYDIECWLASRMACDECGVFTM